MEESKKAAAALQAKDRQASRQMDSEVMPALNSVGQLVLAVHCHAAHSSACLVVQYTSTLVQHDAQRQLVACSFNIFSDWHIPVFRRMTVTVNAAQTRSKTASVKMSQLLSLTGVLSGQLSLPTA